MRLIPWLKARTNRQQQDYLLSTIRILVYAAEQIYGAGKGSSKYQYVQNELEERGLRVDAAAIEAAVREMNLIGSWETSLTINTDGEVKKVGEAE